MSSDALDIRTRVDDMDDVTPGTGIAKRAGDGFVTFDAAVADLVGLQAALDAKAGATATIAALNNITNSLALKADAAAVNTSLTNLENNKAESSDLLALNDAFTGFVGSKDSPDGFAGLDSSGHVAPSTIPLASGVDNGGITAQNFTKLNLLTDRGFYADRHSTSGSGTSGSPFNGYQADTIAALITGTQVTFPDGVYANTSTLDLTGSVPRIRGEGSATLLRTGGGTTTILKLSSPTGGAGTYALNYRLSGLKLDGGGTAKIGLDMVSVHYGHVENVTVGNVTGVGSIGLRCKFGVSNVIDTFISSLDFGPVPEIGMYFDRLDPDVASAVTVTTLKNCITTQSAYGIYMADTTLGFSLLMMGGFADLCNVGAYIGVNNEDCSFYGWAAESCTETAIKDYGKRTSIINVRSVGSSAKLYGHAPIVIGSYFSGGIDQQADGAVYINCSTPPTLNGAPATAIIMNGGQYSLYGVAIQFATSGVANDGQIGTVNANGNYKSGVNKGDYFMFAPTGKKAILGGIADTTGTRDLYVEATGVTQFVLAPTSTMWGLTGAGVRRSLYVRDNNDFYFGDANDRWQFRIGGQVSYEYIAGSQLALWDSSGLTLNSSYSIDSRQRNYTVGTLPTAGSSTKGRLAFATNGRKGAEGAAAGTGVLAYDDGTAWRRVDDGSTVAA